VAVPRRPALDDVADVDVLAAKPHALGDDLREQLSRAPDERLALRVLVRARPFADEDESRLRIADAEDEMAATRRQLAPLTVADVRAEIVERFDAVVRRPGSSVRRRRLADGAGVHRRGARHARHAERALIRHVCEQRARELAHLAL